MIGKTRGRRPDAEITDPQRKTLKEICIFIGERGFPPTMKELADILGISHSSAHDQVSQLVRKGYMNREPKKARGLVITDKARDQL
jgi:repressor LexA